VKRLSWKPDLPVKQLEVPAIRLPRVRVTVRQMMALVCLMAVGLMIARHVVACWGPSEATTIAPIVLLASNVLAWFQRPRWQVFWIGFGLCGWAYMTFSVGSPLAEYLPTARLLDGLHEWFYAAPTVTAYVDFGEGVISRQAHGEAFRRAGQSLFSLLFALLGGGGAIVLFPPKAEDRVPIPPDGSLLGTGWRDATRGRPEPAQRVAYR
jgi:hypothetical protein